MAQEVLKDLNKVRNIGIMAHIDAGKTTTTALLLLLHPVSGGRTVVSLADLTVDAGVEDELHAVVGNLLATRVLLVRKDGCVLVVVPLGELVWAVADWVLASRSSTILLSLSP